VDGREREGWGEGGWEDERGEGWVGPQAKVWPPRTIFLVVTVTFDPSP